MKKIQKKKDFWKRSSDEMRERAAQSMKDIEEGNTINLKEFNARIKRWKKRKLK